MKRGRPTAHSEEGDIFAALTKISITIVSLVLLLVACAGPPRTAVEETGERVPPTTAAKQPTPEPIQDRVTSTERCSVTPLGESVLLAQFDREKEMNVLMPVDPLSLLPLCDYPPLDTGLNSWTRFSTESATAAVVGYSEVTCGLNCRPHGGLLHLVDLQNWQSVATTVKVTGWVAAMTFSADGRQLALAYGEPPGEGDGLTQAFHLLVLDVARQQVTAETVLSLAPEVLAFTPDGSALMAYGVLNRDGDSIDSEPHALLLDAASLEVTWEVALKQVRDGATRRESGDEEAETVWWTPAIMLAPAHMTLYIVHADEDKLTSVNFAERAVSTIQIQAQVSWLERLLALTARVAYAKEMNGTSKQGVLSPDGARLYVIGETSDTETSEQGDAEQIETPLGLQVIDVGTGTEIAHIDTEAYRVALSADGSRLYLQGWTEANWTDILDLETLEVKARLTNRYPLPGKRLNGEAILLSEVYDPTEEKTILAVLDPQTLEELGTSVVEGYAGWVLIR